MRLTLRTLLAWLDGVLPGDEQQELGAKVAASAVATHLTDRIRAAVGRTAIGAPKTEGRGLTEDPNSVAEYLDNTLASDQLEAFERICIESEVHLAEVAACHGILAELARDPSVEHELHGDERQRVQQRLRGLLAGLQDRPATDSAVLKPRGEDHRESRETARAIREAVAAGSNGHPTAASQRGGVGAQGGTASLRSAQRPGGGRSPFASWASAAAALALLAALVGTLVWSLAGRSTVGPDGRRPAAAASDVAADTKQHPTQDGAVHADGEPEADPPELPEAAVEVGATPGTVAAAASAGLASHSPASAQTDRPAEEGSLGTIPGVAAAMPSVTGSAASPPGGREPQLQVEGNPTAGPLATTVATTPSDTAPAGAPNAAAPTFSPAPAAPTPGEQDEAVGFVGGEGVLLHRVDGAGAGAVEWSFLPAGSQLGKREDLLVPPVFQPELHVRGVTIRLLPESRAVLSIDADGTPRIEIVFGRAVARASRADARLGITAAGMVGTVDAGLLNPVAVEVELVRSPGADPANTPPLVRSRVGAVSRGIAWRQTAAGGLPAERPLEGIDAQGMLEAGMTLEWTSVAPVRVAVLRNRPQPAWVEPGDRIDKIEKSAGEALAAKVAATVPLTRGLRELAADRRVENRMLAAATLALLGEFDDLVEQLSAEAPGRKLEQRQWTQFQASTVPLALARGGNAAQRLYESFVNRGPHGKANALWAMARGFTDDDVAAGVDRALVEALDDPSLIVRRYAIQSLVDITQPSAVDRSRYRPDGLPEMRRDGVNWWKSQLEKGLIRRTSPAVGTPGRVPAEPASPPSEE